MIACSSSEKIEIREAVTATTAAIPRTIAPPGEMSFAKSPPAVCAAVIADSPALIAAVNVLKTVIAPLIAVAHCDTFFTAHIVSMTFATLFSVSRITSAFLMIHVKKSSTFSANSPTASPTLSQSTPSSASDTRSIPPRILPDARSKSLIIMPSTFDLRSVN